MCLQVGVVTCSIGGRAVRFGRVGGVRGIWLDPDDFDELLELLGTSDLLVACEAVESEMKRIADEAQRASEASQRTYRAKVAQQAQWRKEFSSASPRLARAYSPGSLSHRLALGSYCLAQQGYSLRNAGLGNMVTNTMTSCMNMFAPGPGLSAGGG